MGFGQVTKRGLPPGGGGNPAAGPLQIAGNVRHGGLFETAFGMSLGQIVEDLGGGTASGRAVKAVQVGGPLGAYLSPEQFDTPFGYEEFDGQGALIGHAGLVVFDDSADMLGMARFAMEFCAIESARASSQTCLITSLPYVSSNHSATTNAP